MQSRDAYEAALEFIRDGNLDRAERALLESMRAGVTVRFVADLNANRNTAGTGST